MIRIFTHVVTFVNASPPPSHLLCPSHFLGIPPSPNRQALPHSRLWPWLFPREYHCLLLIPQIFAHNETFSALFFISFIVSDILSLYISICSISIKDYRLPSVLFPDVFLVHILCSINISWLVKWTLMSLRTPILDIGLASNHFPHPKRGWDKNGFPRRGSIYFLPSVDLSWTQGRCQPEHRVLQWIVLFLSWTKEAWSAWGWELRSPTCDHTFAQNYRVLQAHYYHLASDGFSVRLSLAQH